LFIDYLEINNVICPLSDKITIPFLLIAGVAAIACGMLMNNNYVFIAGIVLALAGYRLIRKKLKSSLNKKVK
jgi:hypothetical protein